MMVESKTATSPSTQGGHLEARIERRELAEVAAEDVGQARLERRSPFSPSAIFTFCA